MSGSAADRVARQEVVQWPGQEVKAGQGEHGYAPAPPEAPKPQLTGLEGYPEEASRLTTPAPDHDPSAGGGHRSGGIPGAGDGPDGHRAP